MSTYVSIENPARVKRLRVLAEPAGVFAYLLEDFNGAWRQVWAVPYEGGTPYAVTTQTTTFDMQPEESPDGSLVAFLRGSAPQDLMVANGDGSGGEVLLDASASGVPTWHPSGSHILYRDDTQFRTIQPDGTGAALVTPTVGTGDTLRHPTYNRDGTLIAFRVEFTSLAVLDELWVCDADGSNPAKLDDMTLGSPAGFAPSWAHGSDTVAYVKRVAGVNHLCVINADGSGFSQLTNTSISPALTQFAWLPDDSKIIVAQADASPWTLYAVDPGGGQASIGVNARAAVSDGIPEVKQGRVYFVQVTSNDMVSTLGDGTDLRVEHDYTGGSDDFPQIQDGGGANA